MPKNTIEKVLAKGEPDDSGCLVWTRGKNSKGYPVTSWHGKYVRAHRLVYEELIGPLQEGEIVMHTCDNPSCINPDHLKAGTQLDNMRDMIEKGRDHKPGRKTKPVQDPTNGRFIA